MHYDVVIIGAGISGIGTAYHLQRRCPSLSYCMLEARESLGGTWDLFRYPGIRSDSDMFTLGFSFRPWTDEHAIADGASILQYLKDTSREFGIHEKIDFGQRATRADWSSQESRWTLSLEDSTGREKKITCRFLAGCTGYYRYDRGHSPTFPQQDRFAGRIVHPQQWTDDIDYRDKEVVVIGSGATAMTLVPKLAEQAKHVTMLQRSPTYVMSRPAHDTLLPRLQKRLSDARASQVVRWKQILFGQAFYQFSRRFPRKTKELLLDGVKAHLGEDFDVDRHFNPTYDPWDQRLCLVPDKDLFLSIRSGRVSVVTDAISHFEQAAVAVASGPPIKADLIVTATGLELQVLGGMSLAVDDVPVSIPDCFLYKGVMFSDVPNLGVCLGYSNASWTLKSELAAIFMCRVLRRMQKKGHRECRPKHPPSAGEPHMALSSGYVQRAQHLLPKQGARVPWRLYQNYPIDKVLMGHAPVSDGVLQFR